MSEIKPEAYMWSQPVPGPGGKVVGATRHFTNGMAPGNATNPQPLFTADALSQARAEGRREGLEAGAAAATDLAQQWDDGEGSRTFNACMVIQDKLLEMAREGKDAN